MANQGDCYYRLQYYEQAIESWTSLLAHFPEAPEAEVALYRIADTQFGLARFDAAASQLSVSGDGASTTPRASSSSPPILNPPPSPPKSEIISFSIPETPSFRDT